jgi:transposase InsO family protein
MIALVLFPGFRNASFDQFCLEHGIDQQFSAPRVPQQNGVMKRKNRTLVEMARIMLDEHRTPRCFWADAISTACYISNRIFPHSILHLTPFELRFERKPSVSYLRPFGCKCFVLKPAFCLDLSLMVDFIECSTLRLRASLF